MVDTGDANNRKRPGGEESKDAGRRHFHKVLYMILNQARASHDSSRFQTPCAFGLGEVAGAITWETPTARMQDSQSVKRLGGRMGFLERAQEAVRVYVGTCTVARAAKR